MASSPRKSSKPAYPRKALKVQRKPRSFVEAASLRVLRYTSKLVTLYSIHVILSLQSAHAAYGALGATLAAGIAKVLKLLIRQPRPDSTHKVTYGMPSTHSASIGFMGTYLVLVFLLLEPHPRIISLFWPWTQTVVLHWSDGQRLALAGLAGAATVSVWWSRVRLGHHTPAQVFAGGSLGSVIAIVAFAQWEGSRKFPLWSGMSQEGWKVPGYEVEGIGQAALKDLLEACRKREVNEAAHIILKAIEDVFGLLMTR